MVTSSAKKEISLVKSFLLNASIIFCIILYISLDSKLITFPRINNCYFSIIVIYDFWENMEKGNMGGSMRLGAYPAVLKKGTIAQKAYGEEKIVERHRHRFEVNPEYVGALEEKGLVFSGRSPDGMLMEIAELPTSVHPFFLGTQFHPEFEARPLKPHPIFNAFIKAAIVRGKHSK